MLIEVSQLTRYYGEDAAIRDVTFTVAEGTVTGLLGLNGAGKSTTLKILAGLMPPSSGTVRIDGVDLRAEPARLRAGIGYLPEDPPLYLDMTVREFVSYMGRLKGMPAEQVSERLPGVLKVTQLTDRADQVIATLSHGYRKRVGIAQAIIHNPRLVILDEPISGLDPRQIADMRKVVRDLAKGRAVLVSSHNLAEVQQTCDRLLVLHRGKLVREGTEEELTRTARLQRLQLIVRGEPRAFESWLGNQPGVTQVDVKDAAEGEARAVVTLDGDHREAIAKGLIDAGFGLRGLELGTSPLEALFLGITADGDA